MHHFIMLKLNVDKNRKSIYMLQTIFIFQSYNFMLIIIGLAIHNIMFNNVRYSYYFIYN